MQEFILVCPDLVASLDYSLVSFDAWAISGNRMYILLYLTKNSEEITVEIKDLKYGSLNDTNKPCFINKRIKFGRFSLLAAFIRWSKFGLFQ